MNAASMPPAPSPPADRVRVINRSVRCFIFGVIGVIPCFGLGTAWLAFRLFLDLAAETREPVKLYPLYLTSMAGAVVAIFCCAMSLPDGVLADVIFLLGFQLLFLRRQYFHTTPAEWNPARHLMYWGLGLANLGLIFSTLLVLFVIYSINHS
jgi:hypothetical protein